MTAQEHLDYWLAVLRETEGLGSAGAWHRRWIAAREVRRWAAEVCAEHRREHHEAVERDAELHAALTRAR